MIEICNIEIVCNSCAINVCEQMGIGNWIRHAQLESFGLSCLNELVHQSGFSNVRDGCFSTIFEANEATKIRNMFSKI